MMYFIKSFFFLLLILLFTNCSRSKNISETSAVKDSGVSYDFFNDVAPGDSLFTSIRKGACFGKCPIYTMKIYNKGTVVLEGQNFIDKIGTYTKRISPEEMYRFISKAKEIDYMNMDDSYDNKAVTDLPTITTSIVIDGTRKSVARRFNYPKVILQFEALFNDLIETDGWRKIEKNDEDKF